MGSCVASRSASNPTGRRGSHRVAAQVGAAQSVGSPVVPRSATNATLCSDDRPAWWRRCDPISMSDKPKRGGAPIDGRAYREALIAAGLLRPHPEFTLLDETGAKPLAKYKTRALEDAKRLDREWNE